MSSFKMNGNLGKHLVIMQDKTVKKQNPTEENWNQIKSDYLAIYGRTTHCWTKQHIL